VTKHFQVEEEIKLGTKALRSGHGLPRNLRELLLDRNVDIAYSVLIADTPDQGCRHFTLIDQSRRLVELEIECLDASPKVPQENDDVKIVEWSARSLDDGDWWWREHPRMTRTKPNNTIAVGLELFFPDHDNIGVLGSGISKK
jgi:hypothetical protein